MAERTNPTERGQRIEIGTVLYGFCGGWFGRDSYNDKRVEGIGADWVVARDLDGRVVHFAACSPDDLKDWIAR